MSKLEKDNGSKCMNGYEKTALNAKTKGKKWLKRLEGVCPMALNAKMEGNADGPGCQTKDRHDDSDCQIENMALNSK